MFAAKVRKLQDNWLPYGSDPKHPYFYRLGIPRLAELSSLQYKERTKEMNPILESEFLELYRKIQKFFSQKFECDVLMPSDLARPGFFIFHQYSMSNGGVIHFDNNQYRWIREQYCSDVDINSAFTFVIPIELTKNSGLCFWNLHFHDSSKDYSIIQNMQGTHDINLIYNLGSLYHFDGLFLHQVSPNPTPPSEKRRITLQGHLIRKHSGEMLMFW